MPLSETTTGSTFGARKMIEPVQTSEVKVKETQVKSAVLAGETGTYYPEAKHSLSGESSLWQPSAGSGS